MDARARGGAGRERGAYLVAARGASLSLVRPRALEVEVGVEVGAMSRTQKHAILPHAVQLRPPGHAPTHYALLTRNERAPRSIYDSYSH